VAESSRQGTSMTVTRPSHAQLALLIRNATKGHFELSASIPHISEQYA
jgi:hypothetical protein